MTARKRVALVSADLMFGSQLAAALRRTGAELSTFAGHELEARGFDTAFVDLNADTPHRLGLIARLHEANPAMEIVAFCHHGEKDLRIQAMQLGASSCVTNGALQAVALRLAGVRPTPAAERGQAPDASAAVAGGGPEERRKRADDVRG